MARTEKIPPSEEPFFSDLDHARLESGWGIGSLIVILFGLYLAGLWIILVWLN